MKTVFRSSTFRAVRRIVVIWGLVGLLGSGCAAFQAERDFQTGVTAFRQGKYTQALTHARQAYQQDPDSLKYKALLGWANIKQNRLDEAQALFKAINAQDKDNIRAVQGFAWLAYIHGRLDEAQNWFDKQRHWARRLRDHAEWQRFKSQDQIYIESCLSDAEYGLGLIAATQKQFSRSESLFKEALCFKNSFSGAGPIRIALGNVMYIQGKYLAALRHYAQVLAEEKSLDEMIWVKLIWCHYYAGTYAQAETLLAQSLPAAKDRRPFTYVKIFILQAQGKNSAALRWVKALIAQDPIYADTAAINQLLVDVPIGHGLFKNFARSYFARGDFSQASAKIRRYLTYVDHDCDAELLDAWCDLYLKHLLIARTEFKHLSACRECDPIQSMLGRGVTALYLGLYDEAEHALIKVQSRAPENLRARVAMGALAFLKGDYDTAIQIYTAYLDQLPAHEGYFSWGSHALNNLGWSYYYQGDYASALKVFQRLKRIHPQPIYADVFNGLGWAYLKNKDEAEAKAAFEKSLALLPQNDSALAGLSGIKTLHKTDRTP